jgi:hypothetical protein
MLIKAEETFPVVNTYSTTKDLMSNLTQQLEDINKELIDIDENIAKLHELSYPLEAKRQSLIGEEIVNKKMLTNSEWEVEPSLNGSLCLNYKGDIEDAIMAPIENLSNGPGIYWLTLEDGIELRMDRNYVTLTFDDPKKMPRFVATHKLVVDGAGILNRLHDLRREISAMELMYHQLGLKG